jgi:ankyrin repeat protein
MRVSICVLFGFFLIGCHKATTFSPQDELVYHCRQPEPGSLKSIENAIKNGARIDLKDEYGRTPFLAASYGVDEDRSYANPTGEISEKSNNPALLGGVAYQDEAIKVLRLLAEHGADIRAVGPLKRSAMHLAASMNREKVIEHLIASGLPMNQQDSMGYSPLMTAVTSQSVRAAKTILKYHPDLSIRTIYEQDVFSLAKETQNDTLIEALRSQAKP